ncbi:MAG TPA: DUF1837 domain-containing protein, partial [Alphaproteobacteria bacterium]|nr:DUF1837 domain-containing protein [Alphaproteobacteria bacterium]
KVMSCLSLFAAAKLRIDYVGLLMSNTNARANINRNSQTQLHNLLLMSLGIDNPSSVVKDAFDKLENDL